MEMEVGPEIEIDDDTNNADSAASAGDGWRTKTQEPKMSLEKVKERAAAAAQEKERLIKEKMERVKAGLKAEKRKKELEERAAKKARVVEESGLYGGLPAPDPVKDKEFAETQKKKAGATWHKLSPLPAADTSKVIFLDVDGVLRPLSAGGFRAMMVDGEWALRAETADFFSGAMLALRHIVESTGAVTVLSSEWRRDEPMREGVDSILKDYGMPPCVSWTPTDLTRDMGTENPFQAFTERRAREISQWLAKNPSVKQWVVLDDINMSTADEERKAGTLRMTERMVQTHRMKGLNHEDAKAAVKILNGEKIAPWILKVQPTMELL